MLSEIIYSQHVNNFEQPYGLRSTSNFFKFFGLNIILLHK